MKQVWAGMALLALACAAHANEQPRALRDPFARPAAPVRAAGDAAAPDATEASEQPPRLRAVMYTPGRSLANIDGRILAPGEWLGEYRVTEIRERSVTLVRRGAKHELQLDRTNDK